MSLASIENRSCLLNGCGIGCGILLLTLLIPYLLNLAIQFGGYFINKAIRDASGVTDYTMTIGYQASRNVGEHLIVVRDGTLANIQTDFAYSLTTIPTIENLFNEIPRQIATFPLNACTFEYEPTYGYPRDIKCGCPMLDCFSEISIVSFQVDS